MKRPRREPSWKATLAIGAAILVLNGSIWLLLDHKTTGLTIFLRTVGLVCFAAAFGYSAWVRYKREHQARSSQR